jgi:membrane-associated phospholipid phosphatase
MRRRVQQSIVVVLLLLFARQGVAQQSSSSHVFDIHKLHFDPVEKDSPNGRGTLAPGEDPENRLFKPFLQHMARDQKTFWMSTKDIAHDGANTFVPFAAFTGLLIAEDSWISKQVPASHVAFSKSLSNYATYSMIAATGSAYLWGHITNNEHLQETGFLSGESALNGTAIAYLLKTITARQRPYEGNGNGNFFHGGSSFPSEHSAVAWSIASIVAHEYPGPLTKFLAYGAASAITVTRVTGKQHFSSDVVIGSALGWYLGRQIFRAHHDPELGGTAWGELVEKQVNKTPRKPEDMGSPSVSPDSWVYPLFDRLAALGYVETNFEGQRPWTRMECARLVEEVGETIRYSGVEGGEGTRIYGTLAQEFSDEIARWNGAPNIGIKLDSVYARATNISGTPLTDGYHFGQTIIDDYGRPYAQGFNSIFGATAYAVAGPFFAYAQGEEQHAAAMPSFPNSVLQAYAAVDQAPGVPNGTGTINRFLLLNGSFGLNFKNLRLSFGRQAQWLGPGQAGPLLYSDNSRSIVMFQAQSATSFRIPLLSNLLGPAQTVFFLGELSGQQWIFNGKTLQGPGFNPQPYIHGDKLSFRPTENLEIGMGITAIFGGPGLPFTFGNFLKTYYSHKANISQNPGKRFSAFDFNYRVPGLRNWMTLYLDSLVGDEISPIGSTRPVLNPGVYLPRIPKVPKLDLRVEGVKDPMTSEFAPGFSFFDRRYRSGYTNGGYLLGSWIGRAGTGVQAWSTYWFSPRTKVQLGYRHEQVDPHFLEGGHLNDFSVRTDIMLGQSVAFTGSVQYEKWGFPLLAATAQNNVTASMQLTFFPHFQLRK